MFRLLAIDGLNLIRRIYAANDAGPNPQAGVNNTIAGCHYALRRLLNQFEPTHAVVAFDGEAANWRKHKFPGYKSSRNPMPPLLAKHMDAIQESMWKLGVDSLLSENDEADDLIATISQKITSHDGEVIIVSTDKGFCQLIGKGVTIWDYFHRQQHDSEYVKRKFNVLPGQLVDYWSLTGVSSLDIPGIKGVGPKTAQSLISEFGYIKQMVNSEANNRYLNYIRENYQQVQLFQQLIRLKSDLSLNFSLRDIRLR